MSAALHLAGPDDLPRVITLVNAFHSTENIEQSDETRQAAIAPLLEGSPHGAIWLIGPRRAPIGYIAISFGWSIEMGGMDGFIDEFFLRETVRGRGVGTEVLVALLPVLKEAGMKALHLEVDKENSVATGLYRRLGFRVREKYNLMTYMMGTASP